ncbi:hypothetical protein [Oceanobacillus timonensis]|uniref:hypothetical protein n=1 Tax=Oceanobacillus timonensis TaxID=1926285 RepID=UPI0009BB9FC9|nr:hypothetical protein [Oceanobacillus timonensis]
MNKEQLEKNIYKHATELLTEKGYVSPIDILMKMDKLSKKQVEDWRFKRIPDLEKVISLNLGKLNYFLQTLKKYGKEQQLKPSFTVYKSWGKGPKKTLRFSKTGNPHMEKLYSTHYVKQS